MLERVGHAKQRAATGGAGALGNSLSSPPSSLAMMGNAPSVLQGGSQLGVTSAKVTIPGAPGGFLA